MIKQKMQDVFNNPKQNYFIQDFAGGFFGTGEEVRMEFCRMLTMRINRNTQNIGRKFEDNWQRNMMSDGRAINNYTRNRIIEPKTICTDIFVKRYGRMFLLDKSREV